MPDDRSPTPEAEAFSIADPIPGPAVRRRTRRRDRHDRGMRGRPYGDTDLAPSGVPVRRTRAENFDDIALRVLRAVVERWTDRLGEVELAVEEVPVLPDHWSVETVPLSAYVAKAGEAPRLVLFRRPLEHRAESGLDLESLLLGVIVEQLAEVLGIPAEDVHPGYDAE